MTSRWACLVGLAGLSLPALGLELSIAGPLNTTCRLATDLPAGVVDITLAVDQPEGTAHVPCGITGWVHSGTAWRTRPCLLTGNVWPQTFHLRIPCLQPGGTAGLTGWMAGGGHVRLCVIADVACDAEDIHPRLLDLEVPAVGDDGSIHLQAGGALPVRVRPAGDVAGVLELSCTADILSAAVLLAQDGSGRSGTVHLREPGSYRCTIKAPPGTDPLRVSLPPVTVAPDPEAPRWQPLALRAPLTTTVPVVLRATDAGVRLRVWTPDALAGQVCVSLEAKDAAGHALPCDPPVVLRGGDQRVAQRVLAGLPSQARIAWWCAVPVAMQDTVCVASLETVPRLATDPQGTSGRLLDVALERRHGCLTLQARPSGPVGNATVRLASLDAGDAAALAIPASREDAADGRRWWRWKIGCAPPGYHATLAWPVGEAGSTSAWPLPEALLRATGVGPWSPLTLATPLVTILPVQASVSGPHHLSGTVAVAGGGTGDAHLLAWAADGRGTWWQRDLGPLLPGQRVVDCDLAPDEQWTDARGVQAWGAAACADIQQAGLAISASTIGPIRIWSGTWTATPMAPPSRTPRLMDLSITQRAEHPGERFEVQCRIDPEPANPCDPRDGALDLVAEPADGSCAPIRLPAYWAVPMARRDRGDQEELLPTGPGRFIARYRPSRPGIYRLRLVYHGAEHRSIAAALPDLVVTGPAHDLIAHVDAHDPRFFSADAGFLWPLGPNLRSITDERSQAHLYTRPTPARGSFAYDAYLQRLAANGATAVEVWMSPWNLALEWREDWAPYHGVGRYSQEHAWGIEHLLDTAWSLGMRVVLVVHNHGQASDFCDQDWADNPQNVARGGRLSSPGDLFRDARAIADQDRLNRYLAGRYGDHPGLLLWKLWSEMNLTDGRDHLLPWHQQAVARWHALDAYGHPVASHWCSDVYTVDRQIAQLLDVVCIDAYHDGQVSLEDLLTTSALGNGVGLLSLRRPFLVSEYGGSPFGAPLDQIRAEHHHGPWISLFTGAAAAPMLWWFEWIDQQQEYSPYRALHRFLHGEDLRGGACAAIMNLPPAWWGRCWQLPQRYLGYLLARQGFSPQAAMQVEMRLPLPPHARDDRTWAVTWWDADRGEPVGTQSVVAQDRMLRLRTPPITDHIAFKAVERPAP